MKKNFDSEVSRVVWDTISKLEISSIRKQDENVDDFEKMEMRDKEGKDNLEANSKRSMWIYLIKEKSKNNLEEWCLGGDFNVIIDKYERLGSRVNDMESEMEEFRGFINDMKLTDMSCIGGRFTWFNGRGIGMSILDIFLMFDNLIGIWKITAQWFDQRDISYHYPIWLKSCSSN
ncbi:hypothetical protein KIW84_051128 [Lathyrus oleraceus]|uniref:Reverse transcriptase n=1 Tax=Pisum sativum TaxID=3888 RepID=A0A9D4WLW5_PEA|nr:hypothetical protein KIW84_051128 [Pisum sativum]